MSHHIRNASGRVISLLHDNDEPQRSYSYSAASTSNYAYGTQRGNTSYPNTPDLMRSDSYDSQASATDPASPLTPSSACHEPLFSSAKQSQSAPVHSRTGSRDMPMYHLPPIATIHKAANPVEAKTATSPQEMYRQSSSGQYAPSILHRTSSSSLEDYHYHSNMELRANQLRPAPVSRKESAVHHSVEQSDDYSHAQPSAEKRRAVPKDDNDEDEEMADAGSKKGSKSKNGGQRRYPCKFREICDKTFTTSGHASRHAKIHGGEKTIECSHAGCTKRFTRADNMKQHLETHKKDKSRRPEKLARGTSHGVVKRRQSASSRGSVSRFSTPRDSPPLLSPALAASASLVSPGLSPDGWNLSARPSVPSRTPSGLDALAMVAATEQATVEHEEAARFHYYSQLQHRQ